MENRHGGVQSVGAAIAVFPESFFFICIRQAGEDGRGGISPRTSPVCNPAVERQWRERQFRD